jgi:hypothetical protein
VRCSAPSISACFGDELFQLAMTPRVGIRKGPAMGQIFVERLPEPGIAKGRNFVRGFPFRAAFLIAMFVSGGPKLAFAKLHSTAVPCEFGALQAAGLHVPAASSSQDLQTPAQPLPVSQTAPRADAGATRSAPIVTYERGQLSILAENVRLADIMSALHGLMGTEIDLPAKSSDERIWARLGPGPPRKVISDLLNNTDLNYVIQGSSKDVDGIQSVTLTARSDGPPDRGGAPSVAEASMDNRQQSGASPSGARIPEQEESAAQQPAAEPEAAPTPPTAPVKGPAVASETPSPAPTAIDGQIAHPPPPASMTSDQIVQQLTNMYQQRKQIQQNQTGSTPN